MLSIRKPHCPTRSLYAVGKGQDEYRYGSSALVNYVSVLQVVMSNCPVNTSVKDSFVSNSYII